MNGSQAMLALIGGDYGRGVGCVICGKPRFQRSRGRWGRMVEVGTTVPFPRYIVYLVKMLPSFALPMWCWPAFSIVELQACRPAALQRKQKHYRRTPSHYHPEL